LLKSTRQHYCAMPSVTPDDMPSFLAVASLSVAVLVGVAPSLHVRRDFVCVVAFLGCGLIGSLVFGVGPNRFRSALSYSLHRMKGTGAFTSPELRDFNYDEIAPRVFLGRQPRDMHDLKTLKYEGVTGVVTLNEPWELFIPELARELKDLAIEQLHIHTTDFQGPEPRALEGAVLFMQKKLNEGGKVAERV